MIIITNEPVQSESTGVTALRFRADTFVGSGTMLRADFPDTGHAAVRTFADERAAFQSMFAMLRSRYSGEWVAVSGGQVVEHDRDRKAITRRFFSMRTRGPVCIGFVGPTPMVRQATPFRTRQRA